MTGNYIARLVPANSVRRERLTFVWAHRITAGSLSVINGAPGEGKSLLTAYLAAKLSRGELRGAYWGKPQRSLIVSLEDHRAAVIRPRLEAAGADLELIDFLDIEFVNEEGVVSLVLPDHLDELADAVWQARPALLILDPISAVLSGGVDSHKDASVRRVLAPLARLSEEASLATALVAHTNKAVGDDPLRRSGASIAFTAAARNCLLLGHDPDEEGGDRRLLAHWKSNSGKLAETVVFEITPTLLAADGESDIDTARLKYVGESEHDASAMLSTGNGEKRSETDEAADLLRAELEDGPRPAKDMHRLADQHGIGKKALRRACERLGVEKRREGGIAADGRWIWSLRIPKGPSKTHGTLEPVRGNLDTTAADMPPLVDPYYEELEQQLWPIGGEA
jgi:AAA domain